MWGSGNKVTYELEGHRFLPRAGVFFWACINTFWLEFEKNLKLWLWTSQVMNVQKKRISPSGRDPASPGPWAQNSSAGGFLYDKLFLDWWSKKKQKYSGIWTHANQLLKEHFTTEPPGYTSCFIQYYWVMIHFPSQRLWKNWVTARFLSHSLSHTHTHPADTFYPFWLLRTHEVKLRSLLRNLRASRRVPSLLIISFSWIIGPNLIKNRQGARFELMLPKLKSNILTIGP